MKVTQFCLTLCDPRDIATHAPLSLGFSRQEYWSGLPFTLPGDLPDSGIELASPVSPALAGRFFTTENLGSPHRCSIVSTPLLKISTYKRTCVIQTPHCSGVNCSVISPKKGRTVWGIQNNKSNSCVSYFAGRFFTI